jgi:hypothetical protein
VRFGLIAALVTLLSALVGLLTLNSLNEPRPTIAAVSSVETAIAQPNPWPTQPIVLATPTPLASPTLAAVPSIAPTATVERAPSADIVPSPAPTVSVPVVVETPTALPRVVARPMQPLPPTRAVTAGKLKVGGQAVVATGANDQRLRLRTAPDLQSEIVGRLGNGARVQVIDGPRQADGETWWRIRHAGGTGWAAGTFMQPAA